MSICPRPKLQGSFPGKGSSTILLQAPLCSPEDGGAMYGLSSDR